jgi:hypothetical protein
VIDDRTPGAGGLTDLEEFADIIGREVIAPQE